MSNVRGSERRRDATNHSRHLCIYRLFPWSSQRRLRQLLRDNLALLSQVVLLELYQGLRGTEAPMVIRLLSGLRTLPLSAACGAIAMDLLKRVKNKGLTLGIPDLLIAAQAIEHDAPVLSRDHIFAGLSLPRR